MEQSSDPLWPQLTLIAAVAVSHMSMPNHWLPYSLVARAQSWTLRKALFLTFLGALGHVSNTVLISVLISGIGGALISEDQYQVLSSCVMLAGGLYYLYTYFVRRSRSSCCDESGGQTTTTTTPTSAMMKGHDAKEEDAREEDAMGVNRAAEVSLVMLTSLSPCVGSMPVLISVVAPPVAFKTVVAAGTVLLVCSAGVMCLLVGISYLGAASLDFGKIRRHERLVLGLGLVLLAGMNFFVFGGHHHGHHHGHDHGDEDGGRVKAQRMFGQDEGGLHGELHGHDHGHHGHHDRHYDHDHHHDHDHDHDHDDGEYVHDEVRMVKQTAAR